MILICILAFSAAVSDAFNQSRMDALGTEVFNRYNENAETFQTGVLVRLDDDIFPFGNASDPLGLSCTEGYMRPVVLNTIRSAFDEMTNIYRTQVVMKNLTIFYKDCRVIKESNMFMSGPMSTPCFLTLYISDLIGWALIRSQKNTKNTGKESCQNSIDIDLTDDIPGSGTVRLFFLRSSTLNTFSLVLNYLWTRKIQEAVARTSLILLSDLHECLDLPAKNHEAPKTEVTTHQAKEHLKADDLYHVDGGLTEVDEYNEDYEDDYDWEILSSTETTIKNTTTTHEDILEPFDNNTSRPGKALFEDEEDLDNVEAASNSTGTNQNETIRHPSNRHKPSKSKKQPCRRTKHTKKPCT